MKAMMQLLRSQVEKGEDTLKAKTLEESNCHKESDQLGT
jgi:hypothetical protein